MATNFQPLHLLISSKLYQQIERMAVDQETTKSHVVRQILKDYMDRTGRQPLNADMVFDE